MGTEVDMSWFPSVEDLVERLKPEQQGWLTRAYVLSEAMRVHTDVLQVQRLAEGLRAPLAEESDRLPCAELPWIREIYLCGEGRPWTYARVVVPQETYQHFQTEFDSLGDNLLGETLLYPRSDLSRSHFEYKALKPEAPLYQLSYQEGCSTEKPDILWARRSIFHMGPFPLLVTEVFLPDMPSYATTD